MIPDVSAILRMSALCKTFFIPPLRCPQSSDESSLKVAYIRLIIIEFPFACLLIRPLGAFRRRASVKTYRWI